MPDKPYAFGIDISLWQHNLLYKTQPYFNLALAKERGVDFVLIKATERIRKDPAVDVFQDTARRAGLPRGFYHFARYSRSSGVGAADQAAFFWNVIKNYNPEFPPILDLEDITTIDGNSIGMSWIKIFMDTMFALSGKYCILYTTANYYNRIAKSNDSVSSWILNHPFWVANYFSASSLPPYSHGVPDVVYTATTMPAIPSIYKGKSWSIWQFSQIGDSYYYGGKFDFPVKSGLDLNVYHGTVAEMYAQFGIGVITPPPAKLQVRTKKDMPSDFLRFRNIAQMYPGDTLVVGRNVVLDLAEPSPVSGRDDDGNLLFFWHVYLNGYEGYISASSIYTELVK